MYDFEFKIFTSIDYYSVVLKGNDLTYQLTSHDEK